MSKKVNPDDIDMSKLVDVIENSQATYPTGLSRSLATSAAKAVIKYLKEISVIVVLLVIICSCQSPRTEINNKKNNAIDNGQAYRSIIDGSLIEIIEIDGCEYLLWHNSYGSDMEHHVGCNNHKNK